MSDMTPIPQNYKNNVDWILGAYTDAGVTFPNGFQKDAIQNAVGARKIDKWEKMNLTKVPGEMVNVPYIKESPVNIECKVKSITKLGSHDLFIADVVAVHVEEQFMDEKKRFHLEDADPIVYSHGTYFSIGKELGKFGYSVKKK